MVAIDLTVELALLMACLVALALIKLGSGLVRVILTPVAAIPFGGHVVGAAENAILGWLDGLSKRMTYWAARFFHGVADSLYLIVGAVLLLFVAQIDLVKWLYREITGPHGTAAVAKLQATTHATGSGNAAQIAAAAAAIVTIKAQIKKLEGDLHTATAASATAAEAAKVPALEHDLTQLGKHVGTLTAQIKALRSEVTVLELVPPAAPGTTTPPAPPITIPGPPGATGATGEPGQTVTGPTGATGAKGEPGLGIGDIDLPGLGTLTAGAAIAATYAIVSTLVNEAGLSRAECRSKVKGICGTDPAAWANLLAGLAVLGFAFNLKDLYGVAEGLVGDLSTVIKEAA